MPDPQPQSANASVLYLAQTYINDFIELATMSIDPSATGCSTVTTVYSTSEYFIGSGTYSFCQCGVTIIGLNHVVSASSTTSYCAGVQSLPAGFTPIYSNGQPVTTGTPTVSTTSPTPTSTPPPPSPPPPPPPPPSTKTTTTTPQSGQPGYYTCGAPFC